MSEQQRKSAKSTSVAIFLIALLVVGVVLLFVGQEIGEQRKKNAMTPTDVTPTGVTWSDMVTPTDSDLAE